jgi:hypothetical protein
LNELIVSDVKGIGIRTAESLVPGPNRLEVEIAIAKLKKIEVSTRNRKIIMFLGSKVRPVSRDDNLATIYEPIVQTI